MCPSSGSILLCRLPGNILRIRVEHIPTRHIPAVGGEKPLRHRQTFIIFSYLVWVQANCIENIPFGVKSTKYAIVAQCTYAMSLWIPFHRPLYIAQGHVINHELSVCDILGLESVNRMVSILTFQRLQGALAASLSSIF